ncbi:hypothetical protein KY290_001904 [Solanum tuberosum]|uniref:Uncharacterized protein n=1 Tax=Solanum tuberosum TaxID=4113 RepID=A0ABQ7WNL2_SOLTU|nr:hypothetical protein KY290_001904 [Solanum tuberosum]
MYTNDRLEKVQKFGEVGAQSPTVTESSANSMASKVVSILLKGYLNRHNLSFCIPKILKNTSKNHSYQEVLSSRATGT